MHELWRARYAAEVANVSTRARERVFWSFVVVAWNAESGLLACLTAITNQIGIDRGDFEIVVVDNGELRVCRERLAQLADTVITTTQNVGCSTGRNIGAAYARGALLSFIDDDGLVQHDYAINALKYFQDEQIVALRGRVVAHEHPYFTTLAGHYDRGPQPIEESLTAEGTMTIRAATFMECNGFPDGMVGHEGIHLSFAIRNRYPNAKIIYAPDVVLEHDYMKGWHHFFAKTRCYARIDEKPCDDPRFAEFLDQQLSRRYPKISRPVDKRVARVLLVALRKSVALGVRTFSKPLS
ncbi:MAG: glycosyltransferase family 2 protein [bacterium]